MCDKSSEVYKIEYCWDLPYNRLLNQVYTSKYFTLENYDKIIFSMTIVQLSSNIHNLKIFKKGIFNLKMSSITIKHLDRKETKIQHDWENDDVVEFNIDYSNLRKVYCNILFYNIDFDMDDHRILSEASKNIMEKYLLSKEYSDVTINVKDDEELFAHKVVLASHSCVFERMFNTDMKEAKENRISFGEFDIITIKEVLQFMYTGKVARDDDVDLLFKILACAKMYQIEKLQTYCEYKFIANLNVDNVIKILVNIDNLELPKLSEKAKVYLEMHNHRISFVDAAKELYNSKILFEFLANKSGMKMD